MNITPQQRKIALLALVLLLAIGWLVWPSKTPEPVLTAQVTRQVHGRPA